ncbi:MAG: bifunctional 5,10-methylene-tetrahydrofolate dehydrogenase/5,10-methylene-tetrahydrofolate cyclohydrolase [Chloroflexi bacterium]|nr:bifunctional 5,10-methylene-tetrahydrofolate dehydrogenase/5,10-methylene-tetrahydrofolate cyclohydrolase [Chloroflexota bacterium]
MAIIVNGNTLARVIREESAHEFRALTSNSGVPPGAAIVQITEEASATVYTRHLQRAFTEAGVDVRLHVCPSTTAPDEAAALVRQLSGDSAIHAIQIQTPLPAQVSLESLLEELDPAKDVDGIHPLNAGRLAQGRPSIVPATPLGGLEILLHHRVEIAGARAVVVGRSVEVGRPMASLLLQHDATVTMCHSRTRALDALTREADILAVAAGRPGLVTGAMIRPGAAVIDFGTNVVDGKTVGDVQPDAADRAGLLTPVPGGTGPVTTAMLLRNTLLLFRRAVENRS